LTGGITNNALNTNYVSDGDIGFTNSGVFTIGGQNTNGTNTYANPIILGWTANRGKGVTLLAATGGEVDFTGGIRANGTDTTAGITVGDAAHGGTVRIRGTANTYAGSTTVSNGTVNVSGTIGNGAINVNGGTLLVSGIMGNGAVNVTGGILLANGTVGNGGVSVGSGGTLGGSGTIAGVVTSQSGGSVIPGQAATTAGTLLTVNNAVAMNAGSGTIMAVSHNNQTNDQIACVAISYGGTLTVNTNAGDAPLAAGDTFQLFKANSSAFYAGAFSATNLPALSPGLGWSNSLAVNGSIAVVSGASVAAPVAGFTTSVTSGAAPLAVTFTNLSINATNYVWNFGDGNVLSTSSSANVSDTYTNPNGGTYQVILTASGPGGTNAATNSIVVAAAAPVAGLSATPANVFVKQSVAFTNTSTGSYTNSAWSFGDGNVANLAGAGVNNSVSDTYSNTGIYTVQLIVTGAGGSSTNTASIVVKPKPAISRTVLSGGSLSLGGTNGPAGQQYRILTSTNMALSLTNWTPVWTNVVAPDGSYGYTNTAGPNKTGFYILTSP
jgi:PKD repeat protein